MIKLILYIWKSFKMDLMEFVDFHLMRGMVFQMKDLGHSKTKITKFMKERGYDKHIKWLDTLFQKSEV